MKKITLFCLFAMMISFSGISQTYSTGTVSLNPSINYTVQFDFANKGAVSKFPPIPIPTITGGHGLAPAFFKLSITKFLIPDIPSEGDNIFKLLIFSLPQPFGRIVISSLEFFVTVRYVIT